MLLAWSGLRRELAKIDLFSCPVDLLRCRLRCRDGLGTHVLDAGSHAVVDAPTGTCGRGSPALRVVWGSR
jgi:hypothetical protein